MNQYDNLNNALAYEATLGPEIIAQTKGLITHFVAGSSTGGTLTGTSRYLKAVNLEIKSVLKWIREGRYCGIISLTTFRKTS